MASHTKKRGGACSGHRLGRVPSGDTLLVSAPLCGRCLLMEANLCADCDGLDAERIDLRMRDSPGGVKGLALSLLRRTMECRLGELSYVHGASETPLLGETIFQNLRRTAERHGDREALVVAHQGHRSTYRELVAECELVGRGLLARGVRRGDRVGIWSPNRYEWVITQYATAAIGAILVNINPAYRTSELEYVLNQSGISFLILAAGFRQADYRAMLAEVKGSSSRTAGRRSSAMEPARARRFSARSRLRSSSTTRSTSSTRPAPQGFQRAQPSRTTTSSTTATSSGRRFTTPRRTASASPCPSITASAWCSATSPAPRTAPRW